MGFVLFHLGYKGKKFGFLEGREIWIHVCEFEIELIEEKSREGFVVIVSLKTYVLCIIRK